MVNTPQTFTAAIFQKKETSRREAVIKSVQGAYVDVQPIGSGTVLSDVQWSGGVKPTVQTRCTIEKIKGRYTAYIREGSELGTGDGTGGGGSTSITVEGDVNVSSFVHSLADTSIHTGSLSDSQAPQFVKLDGTRSMVAALPWASNGSLNKTGSGALVLDSSGAFTATFVATGTVAMGAALITLTSVNAAGTNSHALDFTQAGAPNKVVATNASGDIIAQRNLEATAGYIYSKSSAAQISFDDRTATGTANYWYWYAQAGVASLVRSTPMLTITNAGNLTAAGSGQFTGLVRSLGTAAGYLFDDRTTITTQQWQMYSQLGILRFWRGADYATLDQSGYFISKRVGAGVATSAFPLEGRLSGGDTYQLALSVSDSVRTLFQVSGAGTLTIVPSGNLILSNNYQYNGGTFLSGFAGAGWKLDYTSGRATMELDDLVVRGRMRVYELLITQIRATNGNIFVTATGKIKTASLISGASYSLSSGSQATTGSTADRDPYHNFLVGDLIRAQRIIPSGGSGITLIQSNLQVTAVADLYNFTATLVSGDAPAAGYEYVRLGNVSDSTRQGSLYLAADDSQSPFMDIVDGVTSFADWGSSAKNKARIGKLTGVSDSFWGTLAGYGIYTNNGYFRNVKINGSAIIGSSVGFSMAAGLYLKLDTSPSGFKPNVNGNFGQYPVSSVGGIGAIGQGPFAGVGTATFGELTTNLIGNPRFANATSFSTGWTGGANSTGTLSTDALFGSTAMQLVSTGSAGNRYVASTITRTSTSNPLTISAWVKSNTGTSKVKLGIWRADLLASSASTDFNIGDQWTYISWVASVASMSGFSTTVNALISNDSDTTSKTIVIGFVQVEERLYATPPVCGDFGTGFAFTGTAHASTSTRASAGLEYYPGSGNMPVVSGSAGAWFWAGTANSGTNIGYRVILHTNASGYLVLRVTPGNALEGYWGPATLNGGTVVPNRWNHAAITSDGGTIRLFLNGVQVNTTSYTGSIAMSAVYVGSYGGTQQWLNGFIGDLFITDRLVTPDEVLMIANAAAPLAITRSNFELVLTEPGYGSITGSARGIIGVDANDYNTFTVANSAITVRGETIGAGGFLFGNNHSTLGGSNLLYDPATGHLLIRSKQVTAITLRGSADAAGHIATFDGVIGITTAGGIWQGSAGTFASPDTGYKLYTSSGKGIWESWLTGIRQVYIEPTDMSLRAGAGTVVLNNSGIQIYNSGTSENVGSLQFMAPNGNIAGYMTGWADVGGNLNFKFSGRTYGIGYNTKDFTYTVGILGGTNASAVLSTALGGVTAITSLRLLSTTASGGNAYLSAQNGLYLQGDLIKMDSPGTGGSVVITKGAGTWTPTSGVSLVVGNSGVTYTPNTTLWSAYNGNFAQLVLQGTSTVYAAFHQAGVRVDAIGVGPDGAGGGRITLGPDVGWTAASVYIPKGLAIGTATVAPAGQAMASNWYNSTGDTGWYNSTWGGGWYMQDASYLRVYGNKQLYNTNRIRSDAGLVSTGTDLAGGGTNISFDTIQSPRPITVAAGATVTVFANTFAGMVLVADTTVDGNNALFITGGLGTTLLGQTIGTYYAAAVTASKACFYSDGSGNFKITNNTAVSRTFNLQTFRIRPNQ